ncbi:MAG: hypothetical protein O7H41_17630 [Planctomycetota bacterium]|nr:hypothetical protein [Planctomycetota bacterium]
MAKEYFVVATFRASSGRKWWRVNRDDLGNLSCTCPGWCRRVARDGSRSCRHVRKVEDRQQAGERASKGPTARTTAECVPGWMGDKIVLEPGTLRIQSN